MLVVNRFVIGNEGSSLNREADFVSRAHDALRALAACDGFVRGRLGRAADEPRRWCLVSEWRSVGAYRRALSSYEVKLRATPLLALAEEEPGAYEVLAATDGGPVAVSDSDLVTGA